MLKWLVCQERSRNSLTSSVTRSDTPCAIVSGSSAASISAALIAAPLVSNAAGDLPAFAGNYADPNHPSCLRSIDVSGKTATLSGTDGNPGCPADGSGKEWSLKGTIDGNKIYVDFSPKGGPKDLTGTWEGESAGIRFPDGNKWVKKQPNVSPTNTAL